MSVIVWILIILNCTFVNGAKSKTAADEDGSVDALKYMMELYNKLYNGISNSNNVSNTVHSFTGTGT